MKEILKKIYKYWMKFAHLLATVNGFVILFIFYFVILSLYAVPVYILRLVRSRNKLSVNSYWKKKDEAGEGLENLKYQF